MNGEISVIIPAYNREELIGETLWSLLSQTVPAKEIIVVDDGSQDGTGEAVLEMLKLENTEKLKISRGRPWPELRVIRQENAGPGAARNLGLAASTGEFIHFFDSDDIAAPNKHEVQLRALQESGADIAYGAWVKGRFVEDERHFSGKVGRWESGKVEVNGGELSVAGEATGGSGVSVNRSFGESGLKHGNTGQPKHWFKPVGPVLQATGLPDEDLIKALLTDWSIVPHACLFRRSILERSGGFPEDIWVGEDHLMFLRCLLAGAKVVHAPGTLTYYRVGGEGKLTSVGEAQKRHARDWARFLLKAEGELADGIGQSSGSKESVTTMPSAWFGFRLRAYEAWRDLEKFFPGSEFDLKKNLEQLFLPNPKHQSSELLIYRLAGWWVRKVAGIKGLLTGSRVRRCFRAGKYGPKEEALFCSAMRQVPR